MNFLLYLFLFCMVFTSPGTQATQVQPDIDKDKDPENDEKKEEGKSPEHSNILLIICDQESFKLPEAEGYRLHGREMLKDKGTSFENHYIAAAMSTPSRGTIFTGQPPQVSGICDQMQMGYIPSMDPDKPNMGKIMKDLGYTTAYYGKFELKKDILYPDTETNYTDSIKEYGFDKFEPDGDKGGFPLQGYHTDTYSGSELVSWLRTNAQELNSKGKPWFTVMSFVNPHDIMWADANLPDEVVQKTMPGATMTAPPDNKIYRQNFNPKPWQSMSEKLDAEGMPKTFTEYQKGWNNFLGLIPAARKDMWSVFHNFYLNLIKDNDNDLMRILNTFSNLDLWKNTIVIFTADHGEMGGAHGALRDKGPFAYEQNSHVPMIIVHPDYQGGKRCKSVTSHLDIIPTMLSMTNASEQNKKEHLAGLPGHDISGLLSSPENAPVDAVRKAALFSYVGLWTVDAPYLTWSISYGCKEEFPSSLAVKCPDLSKRGFLNFVFDGRYKYARYYAPSNFNTPETLEEIFANNDVQLFDLQIDPEEVDNLAVDKEKNRNLILKMNTLLNEMIQKEIGSNNGNFLPEPVPSMITENKK